MRNMFQLAFVFAVLSSGYGCTAENNAQLTGLAFEAGSIFAYTDPIASQEATKFMQQKDSGSKIANTGSAYHKRLAKITAPYNTYKGKQYSYKVYMSPEIKAFSAASGDIRIYQGLMNIMSDDELRFVIAHEMGHVALGHAKKQQWVARSSLVALKGLSLHESTRALSSGVLGQFARAYVTSSFSQYEEYQADSFAVRLLKDGGHKPQVSITALQKLSQGNQGPVLPILSSHPSPDKRIANIKKIL